MALRPACLPSNETEDSSRRANARALPRRHMRTKRLFAFAGLAAALACGGEDGPTEPTKAAVATIEVTGAGSIESGKTASLTAVAKDASGKVLDGRTMTWSSSDTNVVTAASSL